MAFVLRPGKYLIERSRRRTIGAIARVGTGGSVPAPIQAVIDDYARSIAGHGTLSATMLAGEKKAIGMGMKRMAGTWLVISEAGLRWASAGRTPDATLKSIRNALRSTGWSPPADQLEALVQLPVD